MRSVPTTSLDLHSPDVVADPYPFFDVEREAHRVAWHEGLGTYLVFGHAEVGAAQRDRRLGRIWHDKEPASYLEPFNLLHRNQMMENEPPEHTRLRRPVAAAFGRGH
ncbi:MAG: cytochrome P450, partial [Marmoricola sp.]